MGSDWWWIADSLLHSQNEGQQFSIENKGWTIAKKIQNVALNRERDVDSIVGLLGFIYTEISADASKTRMTITKETYFNTLLHMRNAIME